MKQYKLSILAVVLMASGSAFGQSGEAAKTKDCTTCPSKDKAVGVFHYVANNERHYVVSNCVPNSDVELYDRPDGGKLVASTIADAKGEAHFYVENDLPVAFAINHNRVNELGVAGSGMVMPVSQPGIIINNTEVVKTAEEVLLNWNAAVAATDWYFVIQKSTDNEHFVDAATINARGTGSAVAYTWTEKPIADQQSQTIYYRVEARNKAGNKAATEAAPVQGSGKAFFTAQPTVFEGNLQIAISADRLPAVYTVTDMLGRTKYATGIINVSRQGIRLNLPTGTYAISLVDNKARRSTQLIMRK
jgi:hypothetical protein